jgi:hypothetical protein
VTFRSATTHPNTAEAMFNAILAEQQKAEQQH